MSLVPIKISELPTASAVADGDVFALTQSGTTTRKATTVQVRNQILPTATSTGQAIVWNGTAWVAGDAASLVWELDGTVLRPLGTVTNLEMPSGTWIGTDSATGNQYFTAGTNPGEGYSLFVGETSASITSSSGKGFLQSSDSIAILRHTDGAVSSSIDLFADEVGSTSYAIISVTSGGLLRADESQSLISFGGVAVTANASGIGIDSDGNGITLDTLAGTGTRVVLGNASGVVSGLANGSNGQVLTLVSGAPAWADPSGGGGSVDSVTAGDGTITIGGTASDPTVAINLANTNTWTGSNTFETNAWPPVGSFRSSSSASGIANAGIFGHSTTQSTVDNTFGSGFLMGAKYNGSLRYFSVFNGIQNGTEGKFRIGVTDSIASTNIVPVVDGTTSSLLFYPATITWSGNPTHSGNHTWSGTATFNSTLTANGNTTIGDGSSDTLTVNATPTFNADIDLNGNDILDADAITASGTVTSNGYSFYSGGLISHGTGVITVKPNGSDTVLRIDTAGINVTGAVTTTGLTANGVVILGGSTAHSLTVAGSAITWSGNPTHSGNHTFSGSVTLGDGSSDTITVKAVADGTPAKCIGIDGSNKIVSYSVPAGGGSLCRVDWKYVGTPSASAIALEMLPDYTQALGYQIPGSSYVVKLVGLEFSSGSGGTSQATSVTVRIAERARNQASQYTAGAGTTVSSNSLLTVGSATSTLYSVGDSLILATPVTITAGYQVFCDLTANFWNLTDVHVCALLSVEEA